MYKTSVALVTLIAFMSINFSCLIYKTRTEPAKILADRKGKKITIYRVRTTSGEYIEFSKKQPGIFYENVITGKGRVDKKIDRTDVQAIKRKGKGIYEITTKDGVTCKFVAIIEDEYICRGNEYRQVSISLSEIDQAWVKRLNSVATFLVSTFGVGIILLIIASWKSEPPPPPTPEEQIEWD